MPHFTIECSESILMNNSPEEIMNKVYESAELTGLFKSNEIKIKINPYMYYNVGNTIRPFIHINVHLLEGRSREQKHQLSQKITDEIERLLPEVYSISLSYVDLDTETYYSHTRD